MAGDRWLRNGRAHRAFIGPLMDRRFELDACRAPGREHGSPASPGDAHGAITGGRMTGHDDTAPEMARTRKRPKEPVWRPPTASLAGKPVSSQRPRDGHARPCGQRRPSQPPILAAGGGSPVIRSVDRSTVQLGCLRPLRARRTIGADPWRPQHGCPRVGGSLRGTRPHLRPGCGRAVDDPRNPSERKGGPACSTRVPRPSAAPAAGTR